MSGRRLNNCVNGLSAMNSTTSSINSHFRTSRQRREATQNSILIWLNSKIDVCEETSHNSITHFHNVFCFPEVFYDPDECALFITEIKDSKALLFVSDTLGESFVPSIHENIHLDSIYVISTEEEIDTQWTQKWRKVKGVFTNIKRMCESLKQDIKRCERDSEPISVLSLSDFSMNKLENVDQSFMYTLILKDVLLKINYDQSAIRSLTEYCCDCYGDDTDELRIIEEFGDDYNRHSPIWWYSRECFTYRMLNRALRTQNYDVLIKMGFFMRDIHQQIEEIHSISSEKKSFIVYRGQRMSRNDFEKVRNNKNGLLSFNNFLSTTLKREISLRFTRDAQDKLDTIGVIFQMKIDPAITTTPFASIDEVSYYRNDEQEILFSMHTVFRIYSIEKIDQQLWQVELEITADNDQQLQTLITCIQYEIQGSTEAHRLGNLMIHLKQLDNAEKFYRTLLASTSRYDQMELAHLNSQIACVTEQKGDYTTACRFYQVTLDIEEKMYPATHRHLAGIYHNLGVINKKIKEYGAALHFFQRAIEIAEYNHFPENDSQFQFWKDNIKDIQKKI